MNFGQILNDLVDKQLPDVRAAIEEAMLVGRRHDVLSFKAKPGELTDVAPVEITRNYVRSVRFESQLTESTHTLKQ